MKFKVLFILLLVTTFLSRNSHAEEYKPSFWPYLIVGGVAVLVASSVETSGNDASSSGSGPDMTPVVILAAGAMFSIALYQEHKKNSVKTLSLTPTKDGANLLFAYEF